MLVQLGLAFLLFLHVGDRTHTTVKTEVHHQHLHVIHQCSGANTLGLRLLISTHGLGQLVQSHFEKPKIQHGYTVGKTFATKNP